MLDKEKFIDYMTRYKKLTEIEENLDLFQIMGDDFNAIYIDYHHDLILDLLKDLMNDKEDVIDYYIYEIDWGKNGKDVVEDDNTKKKSSLTCLDELYDYIKNNSLK